MQEVKTVKEMVNYTIQQQLLKLKVIIFIIQINDMERLLNVLLDLPFMNTEFKNYC